MIENPREPDDYEEIDYIPEQWDDAEQYPWDCDLSSSWYIDIGD